MDIILGDVDMGCRHGRCRCKHCGWSWDVEMGWELETGSRPGR